MMLPLPLNSATTSLLGRDARFDHLVRGIGHVLLMRVDPAAAVALNLPGSVPGRGTRTNDGRRPAAPRAGGGERDE